MPYICNISPVHQQTPLGLPTMNFRTNRLRTEKLEGRPHSVVPTVMIKVGVLNGSYGPLFYPADELEKSALMWNGRPVVVYHPELNGRGVSAGSPEITNRYKIGTVFNTRFTGTQLVAEAWIDTERVEAIDSRVLYDLTRNQTTEVSTGLFTDNEQTSGTWNGIPYIAIARNHRPDHLAVLPDQVGACSIADGCGLMRNNEREPLVLPSLF